MDAPKKLRKSAVQAKRFLEELANLRDDRKTYARFLKNFAEFFPPGAFSVMQLAASSRDTAWGGNRTPETDERARIAALANMRGLLCEAWAIPNTELRRKQWKIARLRERFHQSCVASYEQMTEPPPDSLMDYALQHLHRLIKNAKVCENRECTARRYFIAARSTRRHCSAVCAGPAHKRYWEEHKQEINAERRQEYRKVHRKKNGKVRRYRHSHVIAMRAVDSGTI
jgi:hypothetical protein